MILSSVDVCFQEIDKLFSPDSSLTLYQLDAVADEMFATLDKMKEDEVFCPRE